MLQTLVIGILILYYKRGARSSAAYAAVYIGLLSYLLSPTAPLLLVWAMQLSVMPLIATARVGLLSLFHSVKTSWGKLFDRDCMIVSGQESAGDVQNYYSTSLQDFLVAPGAGLTIRGRRGIPM